MTSTINYDSSSRTFESLEELYTYISHKAKAEGYALVKQRSKKNPKTGLVIKCFFICDRGGKPRRGKEFSAVRNTSSQRIECTVSMYGLYFEEDLAWRLFVREAEHNHELSNHATAHPSFRRQELTSTIRDQIAHQLKSTWCVAPAVWNNSAQHSTKCFVVSAPGPHSQSQDGSRKGTDNRWGNKLLHA
ncbi:MAG: hypothetical protein Q9214_005209 [Letrouitia sp. 1 TL-2023]